MAIPRVFISSTWYDLRYIRENLKYFIRTLGYDPVLSEEGTVFFDPHVHVQDACVSEIPNCQLFVLIIGGRYGSSFKETERSVTNSEYLEASELRIPVFALVEQAVYSDFQLYLANRANKNIDAAKIKYPSADNTKIFEFIDQVRTHSVNNALVPFRDFADIESYLRQQWAGMMFSFLLKQNETARVTDTLGVLKTMSERVEMLSRQILGSVGTKTAKLTAELYDKLLQYESARDLAYMGVRPTPKSVLEAESFEACFEGLGGSLGVRNSWEESSVGPDGAISRSRLNANREDYLALRNDMLASLQAHGVTIEAYLNDPEAV